VELFEADGKEALLGSLADVFVSETESIFIEELVTIWEGRRRFDNETVLRTLKGRRLDVIFTMTFGGLRYEHTIVTVLDVTARKSAELNAQHLAAVVESSADAIISKDLNGVITSWNQGAERLFGYTPEEAIGQQITILFPGDRLQEEAKIVERIRRGERVDPYDTVRRRKDGSHIDISLTVSPVRNAEGMVVGASKIARDITDRKRSDEQIAILAREAEHRARNVLATVQATVHLTESDTTDGLKQAIEGRIQALANVHTLLAASCWVGAELRSLINQELVAYCHGGEQRARINGPNLLLRPDTAQVIAVAVHELATNAAKYGALSTAQGRVQVEWSVEPDGRDERLILSWRETGGPLVKSPMRQGFGMRVMEKLVQNQLKGHLVFDWRAGGLSCVITLPCVR
jgi:PAS domain S-box-containing protein